ncbi:hypothetical protein ACX3V1_29700 [Escherichia coli]
MLRLSLIHISEPTRHLRIALCVLGLYIVGGGGAELRSETP